MISITYFIADFHIHSLHSRATSNLMNLKNISKYAKIKGISIVGTGDILHPMWLKQVKNSTHQVFDGLYSLQQGQDNVVFILSTEVNLNFKYEQKTKNIHHVLLIPNFEVVEQLYDILSNYGDLVVDGRPTLHLSPPEFIELIRSVSHDIFIFPAHIFTPCYSLFGAFSGFDSLKDCYQDKGSDRCEFLWRNVSKHSSI